MVSQPRSKRLEITLISGQDLPLIARNLTTYAVAYLKPDHKLTTQIDIAGHTNPNWNHKFVFHLDPDFSVSDEDTATTVTFEIYSVGWLRDFLIGSAKIPISNLLAKRPMNRPFTAQLRRPTTGLLQGVLNVGANVIDRSDRSKDHVGREIVSHDPIKMVGFWEYDDRKMDEKIGSWEYDDRKMDEKIGSWEYDDRKMDEKIGSWEYDDRKMDEKIGSWEYDDRKMDEKIGSWEYDDRKMDEKIGSWEYDDRKMDEKIGSWEYDDRKMDEKIGLWEYDDRKMDEKIGLWEYDDRKMDEKKKMERSTSERTARFEDFPMAVKDSGDGGRRVLSRSKTGGSVTEIESVNSLMRPLPSEVVAALQDNTGSYVFGVGKVGREPRDEKELNAIVANWRQAAMDDKTPVVDDRTFRSSDRHQRRKKGGPGLFSCFGNVKGREFGFTCGNNEPAMRRKRKPRV